MPYHPGVPPHAPGCLCQSRAGPTHSHQHRLGTLPSITQFNKMAIAPNIIAVEHAASKLGFTVPEGHEAQYAELLEKTEKACQALLAEEGGSFKGQHL